jgi:hypothetical protein
MPNLIEIGPVVWISIADTHGTHIDFYILRLIDSSKNTQVLINTNGQNQPMPFSSLRQCDFSLSANPFSLCLSFSPICSIPEYVLPVFISLKYLVDLMFIIIDCNKLMKVTMLFHSRIAHNTYNDKVLITALERFYSTGPRSGNFIQFHFFEYVLSSINSVDELISRNSHHFKQLIRQKICE